MASDFIRGVLRAADWPVHLVTSIMGVMPRQANNRLFRYAVITSAVLLVVSVLLLLAGFAANPLERRLSVTQDFHICLWRHRDVDVRLVFFNDHEYGPYLGSILGIVDDQGNVHPPLAGESCWGDCCGIYWRHFRWREAWGRADPVLWTLMVSLWYPLILLSILPVLWFWQQRRRHRRGMNLVHDKYMARDPSIPGEGGSAVS